MAEEKTVLIVDDELRMRRVVSDYLHIKGYEILEAGDGVEALEILGRRPVDLVLLDVMMPRMNGFEVLRRLRAGGAAQNTRVPVIILTARAEEEDELEGFRLGVDEYIAKPFSLKVLLARIEAVLRRGQLQPDSRTDGAPGLEVDTAGRVVRVDGRPVELTYTEYELLLYLMTNAGVALSRDRILDSVWRFDYDGDARTVDTHIKKLRNKLTPYGAYICTVRGIGYRFDPTAGGGEP